MAKVMALFFKAQARGTRDRVPDMFAGAFDQEVEHKGYVRGDGTWVPPHHQRHKVKPHQDPAVEAKRQKAREETAARHAEEAREADGLKRAKKIVGDRDRPLYGLVLAGKTKTIGTLTHGGDTYRVSLVGGSGLYGEGTVVIRLTPKGGKPFKAGLIAHKASLTEAVGHLLANVQEDAVFALDAPQETAAPAAAEKPAKSLTGDPESDAKLKAYRKAAKDRAARGLNGLGTATAEQHWALLEAQAKADPAKWEPGQGVGWKLPGQTNRGFRVVSVDHESKTAVIRQVADTGLTQTGGNDGLIGVQRVRVSDLVRDRKYDAPTKVAPSAKGAILPGVGGGTSQAPGPEKGRAMNFDKITEEGIDLGVTFWDRKDRQGRINGYTVERTADGVKASMLHSEGKTWRGAFGGERMEGSKAAVANWALSQVANAEKRDTTGTYPGGATTTSAQRRLRAEKMPGLRAMSNRWRNETRTEQDVVNMAAEFRDTAVRLGLKNYADALSLRLFNYANAPDGSLVGEMNNLISGLNGLLIEEKLLDAYQAPAPAPTPAAAAPYKGVATPVKMTRIAPGYYKGRVTTTMDGSQVEATAEVVKVEGQNSWYIRLETDDHRSLMDGDDWIPSKADAIESLLAAVSAGFARTPWGYAVQSGHKAPA
jgi:hypothetical protein